MEEVRRASPEDLAACRSLLAHAVGDRAPAMEELLEERLHEADPGALALVGTFEQSVVGLALARLIDEGGRPLALLELCYVEPAAREVGVGSALVTATERWARRAGASGVQAVANPGDRSTKRLLEGAGFKTRWLVLRRPVNDASPPAAR